LELIVDSQASDAGLADHGIEGKCVDYVNAVLDKLANWEYAAENLGKK